MPSAQKARFEKLKHRTREEVTTTPVVVEFLSAVATRQ